MKDDIKTLETTTKFPVPTALCKYYIHGFVWFSRYGPTTNDKHVPTTCKGRIKLVSSKVIEESYFLK